MGLLLLAAVVGLASAPVSGAAPGRTVMAWISTAVSNWDRCAQFLDTGGDGEGTVNAISIDNLYRFDGTTITADPAAISAHARLWQKPGGRFRTYPMIGYGGNITGLRPLLFDPTVQQSFVEYLATAAVTRGYDGINIDFEPLSDVLDPANNPTVRDAVALADLIAALGARLHAVNKTLSLDAMAVTGACWTAGGHLHPVLDRKPCPWIRRFWDLDALSAVDSLDRIITMDTYTKNSTEYAISLQQYHYFFSIDGVGVGLCPVGCGHPLPTEGCVASRIAYAVKYGAAELDLWSLWDSTAHNWTEVRTAWQPWIGPLRSFLAGDDAAVAARRTGDSADGGLCWAS